MKTTSLIFLILILVISISNAQQVKQELSKKEQRRVKKVEPPKKGSIYFTPLPVISVNPAFGLMYGVSTSTSWYMGDPQMTKISSMIAGIILTTKGQTLITAKSTAYSENNDYKLDLDWRYLKSSQATFGLGSGPLANKLASDGFEYNLNAFSAPINSAQLLKYNWFRMYQTLSKKVSNGIYIGLGYHLDILSNYNDDLLDLTSMPPVITSFYAYNNKYNFSNQKTTLSGVSFNGIYDTRDNLNATYKGEFGQISFRVNPSFLGSDNRSTSFWTEYRDYFNFDSNHKNILAFWFYGSFQTSGTLPYMNMPALGYDQYSTSGRGYSQGKIRGQALMYTELEFRKKLFGTIKNPDQWGIVLFCNATTASNQDAKIELLDYIDPAVGVGIRFMANAKARTTICIDYAVGYYKSSGIYLGLNEAF